MFKTAVINIIFFVFLFFIAPMDVYAKEFSVKANINYRVDSNGLIHTQYRINLTNLSALVYAKNYILSYNGLKLKNLSVGEKSNEYQYELVDNEETTEIKIIFPDIIAGMGNSRTFFINFDLENLAVKSGEIWEVTIPKLSNPDLFDEYNVRLFVPLGLGKLSFISPNYLSSDVIGGEQVYSFSKDQMRSSGISAGFGDFQLFSFKINYHLENPVNKKITTEVAIPPDTAYQIIYYTNINPSPKHIRRDNDGNWLATFELDPRQTLTITTEGTVQILTSVNKLYSQPPVNNTKLLGSSEYWMPNDPKIASLAKKYRKPEEIFDFVVNSLNYNYDKVKPPIVREGAINALVNPNNAICMEYTDLFISIARAAGIPAREINGYAYTEDKNIQPLSLVADVLHAWPEYYDVNNGYWKPIDPTWADTTGGQDFFDNFDLRHFVFVIHGEDATKPYSAGSYKLAPTLKDIYIDFGQLPKKTANQLKISGRLSSFNIINGYLIKYSIVNEGINALYKVLPEVYFDEKLQNVPEVEYILPYSSEQRELMVPFSFFGVNTPQNIDLVLDGEKVTIKSVKLTMIITSLLITSLVFIVIIAFYFLIIRYKSKLSLKEKNK